MNRRDFLKAAALLGMGSLLPTSAWAIGEDTSFTIAKLRYDGPDWDPRPSAARRLLLEVEKRTSIRVDTDTPTVTGETPELFDYPFLAMCGEGEMKPLASEVVSNLRTYLKAGGFLLIDSSDGVSDGPFIESATRELRRILPDQKIASIPKDHVLYKSFYLIDDPVGRTSVSDRLGAVFGDERLLAVISPNDLFGAWARDNFGNWEYSVSPGGERQREMAFRLGINLVMYALTGNYKSDQVHVPFILKRREWKVD
ncbi:MAG: DUF4159 domain-containing protein [Persicimonas sp.]